MGHTASLISERTDNQHSKNLDFYPLRLIQRIMRGHWLALAPSPALGPLLCSPLPSYCHEACSRLLLQSMRYIREKGVATRVSVTTQIIVGVWPKLGDTKVPPDENALVLK